MPRSFLARLPAEAHGTQADPVAANNPARIKLLLLITV
jgi:hypothetical protein